jgi:Domain of unknown function (DUF4191)
MARDRSSSSPKKAPATAKTKRRRGKERAPGEPSRRERYGQIITAFKLTRERDPRFVPWVIAGVLLPIIVIEAIGVLIGHPLITILPALLLGLMGGMVIFGRRAQRAAFAQMDGQPGAALHILKQMRGDWRITEAVAANSQLDSVHRVIARPGVLLVGEGAPHRVKGLLASEKRRVARVVGETPIYDITIGNDEGQVPIGKLQQHLMKMPRNLMPKEVASLDKRLQALSSARTASVPKGPIPAKAQKQINERMRSATKRR